MASIDAGPTGGARVWDPEGCGIGCSGAGGGRSAAASGAGAVRRDAGGLVPSAVRAAADGAADRWPGPAGAPVRRVHRGLAVAVDVRAGRAVDRVGRMGAFDDPLV